MLLAIVVVCALGVVNSRHEARKLLVALQEEKKKAHQMDVEWGQLQLEQGTLSAPIRAAKVLERQLQMQAPNNKEIRFVQVSPNGQTILKP
jgi:cell division protein FtsL